MTTKWTSGALVPAVHFVAGIHGLVDLCERTTWVGRHVKEIVLTDCGPFRTSTHVSSLTAA